MELKDFFKEHPKAAIGFSGGVDSSYLLYEAVRNGADIRPYFIKTAFQPVFELRDAEEIAKGLGLELSIIEFDIFTCEDVIKNTGERCYHCKSTLFGLLKRQAYKDGYTTILDGTNASDDAVKRPGMRALQEMNVYSPLRECGLTKDEIRKRSKEADLFTWNKPAYACLATRVSEGNKLKQEQLVRVENAEEVLFSMGFTDFRVRIFNDAARIQLREEQLIEAVRRRKEIVLSLKPFFPITLLDLEGRE